MNERYRYFWMPAFVAFCLLESLPWLPMAMQVFVSSAVYRALGGTAGVLHPSGVPRTPSIIILALTGGLAAFLARRGGGTRSWAVLAGMVPALAMYLPGAIGQARGFDGRPMIYAVRLLVVPLGALAFSLLTPTKAAPEAPQ
jgi:hypothetical protein